MEVSLFDEQNLKQGHFTPYQSNSPLYYYEYFTKDIIMQAWPSSLLFSDMIQNIPQLCQNRVILDLSCGVGIVGQMCLKKNADYVIFSDYVPEEILFEVIRRGLLKNQLSNKNSEVIRLDWKDPGDNLNKILEEKIDVVFAGDCLYEEENYDAFFGLIDEFLHNFEKLEIYVTYQERGNLDPILMHLDKFDLDIEQADKFLSRDFSEHLFRTYPDTKLFRIIRKKD